MRNKKGQFTPGFPNANAQPVGSVTIRTRKKRRGEQRAFVKIAEPKVWRLRAHVVWESAYGPIPRGKCVHHINEDKLDDRLENLALVTRSEHLDLHRAEFKEKAVQASVAVRRERRWSTKSQTKRNGKPPKWEDSVIIAAVDAALSGEAVRDISARTGITMPTLQHYLRRARAGVPLRAYLAAKTVG